MIQVTNIRQTRNGQAFTPYSITVEGTVIGDENSDIVQASGCYRVTGHESWWKAVTGKEDAGNCKVRKQLVKAKNGYAIIITNAPLEVKP